MLTLNLSNIIHVKTNFYSFSLYKNNKKNQISLKAVVKVVKLADTLDLESNSERSRGSSPLFNILKVYSLMVEHWPFKPQVLGSIPSTLNKEYS